MKRIIVNVGGLSNEEKQRVNEALAKIKNVRMCDPTYWDNVIILYGPSFDGILVGFDHYEASSPTHTPQQVLEMAGMVEKRKVRKDFDLKKDYSVNVLGCSEEEKKEVQQAFFDAGFMWELHGLEYKFLDSVQYSNTAGTMEVTNHLMYGSDTVGCNMTAQEFLDLVYEPENKGQVHAELMAQYAEDAKTHTEPWKLWEFKNDGGEWFDCSHHPYWNTNQEFRRKPKTHTVHGVEIPDLRIKPKQFDWYWCPSPHLKMLVGEHECWDDIHDLARKENGICYEYSEEGKQAAILHAKAWLGI